MASANLQKYTFFWRSESPFSQWYKCKFTVDRVLYNCAEQYMMHQKAVLFGDEKIADEIMKSTSQKYQKSLGRKVSNFNEQIWNDKCTQIVYTGNFAKFSQNKDLKQRLLDTEGTILAEASPVDLIWGIGYAEDHPNARNRAKWRGQNRLGFILTNVRDAILREARSCDDDAVTNTDRAPVVNSNKEGDRKMSEGNSDVDTVDTRSFSVVSYKDCEGDLSTSNDSDNKEAEVELQASRYSEGDNEEVELPNSNSNSTKEFETPKVTGSNIDIARLNKDEIRCHSTEISEGKKAVEEQLAESNIGGFEAVVEYDKESDLELSTQQSSPIKEDKFDVPSRESTIEIEVDGNCVNEKVKQGEGFQGDNDCKIENHICSEQLQNEPNERRLSCDDSQRKSYPTDLNPESSCDTTGTDKGVIGMQRDQSDVRDNMGKTTDTEKDEHFTELLKLVTIDVDDSIESVVADAGMEREPELLPAEIRNDSELQVIHHHESSEATAKLVASDRKYSALADESTESTFTMIHDAQLDSDKTVADSELVVAKYVEEFEIRAPGGKDKLSTKKHDASSSDPQKYTFFWRAESPFSQWYSCQFTVDGLPYKCAEQYMMHQKAVLFEDPIIADQILKTESPREQKSLGRKVSNYNQQVWDENCQKIVYKGNLAKFSQNEDLKQDLLQTQGTVLAEASPMDCIWGIGYDADHPNAKKKNTWRGENRLGYILTNVREAILKGTKLPHDSGKDVPVDSVKIVKEQKVSSEDERTSPNSTQLSKECSNDNRKAVERQKTDQERTFSAGGHSEVLHTESPSCWAKAVSGSATEGSGMKEERPLKEATKDVIAMPKEADCGSKQLALDSGTEGHGKPVAGAAQVDLSNDKDDKGTGGGHSQDSLVKHLTEETSWKVVTSKRKTKKNKKK